MFQNAKSFPIWEYKNCSFIVSSYLSEPIAIIFAIKDNETSEIVAKCTIYDLSTNYKKGMATIKNYSENRGMTNILKELGIVTNIIESNKVNELAEDTETIDVCNIDLEKLREYASDWNYEEREED